MAQIAELRSNEVEVGVGEREGRDSTIDVKVNDVWEERQR